MAIWKRGFRRKSPGRERLDPVRWRVPRRRTLVRASVIAGLLVLAAGAGLSETGAAGRCTPVASRPAGGASATRSPATRPPVGHSLPVPAGLVGVPIRLSEAALVSVVHPGDRVDVLAMPPGKPAATLAANALVLDARNDEVTAVILVATTARQARELAGTPPEVRLGITVRPD